MILCCGSHLLCLFYSYGGGGGRREEGEVGFWCGMFGDDVIYN